MRPLQNIQSNMYVPVIFGLGEPNFKTTCAKILIFIQYSK